MEIFIDFSLLFFPILASSIIYLLLHKYSKSPLLFSPIHSPTFGYEKNFNDLLTVPVTLPLFTWTYCHFFHPMEVWSALFLGLWVGIAFILPDLLNAHFRITLAKMGRSMKKPQGFWKYIPLDKMDSSSGIAYAYWELDYCTFYEALILFGIGTIAHIIISFILYKVGLSSKF